MSVALERCSGGTARIRLSGAALGVEEALQLGGLARELLEERDLRVVLLESAAEDFCPGSAADLDPAALAPPSEALAELPCPVIAVLSGQTGSVGLELALAADFRIAASSVRLSILDALDHDRLPSWGGTQRLPRIAGRSAATAMLLLGQTLTAEAALACGLIDEIAPDPGGRGHELARELSRRAPLALAYAKEAVLRGSELPMRSGMLLEADLNLLLRSTRDRARGLEAFFAKGAPTFHGD